MVFPWLVLPARLKVRSPNSLFARIFCWLVPNRTILQSLLLLIIRLYWGWEFFLTGKGKLSDLDKPTQFFQSLGIPFPHQQAILAGTTECVGGLLLFVGLGSRLVSIPLAIVMTVAYLTADNEVVKNVFNEPDKFLAADEFLFFYAVLLVLLFGPGKISLDWLIKRKVGAPAPSNA
jgi:putative oxidoreductase